MAKIPSRPFPKSKTKIPSRKFAKGITKFASRQIFKAPAAAIEESDATVLPFDRPTNEHARRDRIATLKEQIKSLGHSE